MALKDMNDLPPDESYVVAVMRDDRALLRPGPNPMCLNVEHTPVCTWETLFRLLGRGVIETRSPLPGSPLVYGLAEAWWVDAA